MRNKHSAVSDCNKFVSNSGERYRPVFSSKYRPDGCIQLSESSRIDIQAEINSHVVETDIANIVSRLQRGDTSVLNSRRPMYGDFTKLPSSFAEAFDLVNRSESAFEQLPVDIKQKFDNDVGKWFASIGSPDWLSAMGLSDGIDVTPSKSESEVIE